MRTEIGISLEIILYAFKCLAESLSAQIFVLAWAPTSLISDKILCEFTILPDVYIYCPLRKRRCALLPEGTDVHIWQHIHQKD